jgi:hypothetical protein
MRKVAQPEHRKVRSPGGSEETRSTHPAYAMIGACRTSGHANLYGSDFTHGATIRIRIRKSELVRDLSHDRYRGMGELVEVELSESQWATFISAMNVGDGVPCTLRDFNGEDIPGVPPPADRSEQFAAEVSERAQACLAELDALYKQIGETGLSKKKADELQKHVNRAIMKLKDSIPFIAKSFDEHAEETIEKAKQEIHGYMVGAVTRAGLTHLREQMPLAIASDEDKK